MPRDHHLRQRRLNLGASQELIGCLAGWCPSGAQASVSAVERGVTKTPATIRRVREAILWLELEPRRRRAWERQDAADAAATEAAILLNREHVILNRLVDLLMEGRGDEFDTIAARVAPELAAKAGDIYLDGIHPNVG